MTGLEDLAKTIRKIIDGHRGCSEELTCDEFDDLERRLVVGLAPLAAKEKAVTDPKLKSALREMQSLLGVLVHHARRHGMDDEAKLEIAHHEAQVAEALDLLDDVVPAPEPMPGAPNLIEAIKTMPNIADKIFPPIPACDRERVVVEALALFRSCIQGREPWTDRCQAAYDKALAALAPDAGAGHYTLKQGDAARGLIDALVQTDQGTLRRAWEEACLHWGRFCEPYLSARPTPFKDQAPDAGAWKPCRICFNYNSDAQMDGECRDEPDGSTMLRLTFPAGIVHKVLGKPQYRPRGVEATTGEGE